MNAIHTLTEKVLLTDTENKNKHSLVEAGSEDSGRLMSDADHFCPIQ